MHTNIHRFNHFEAKIDHTISDSLENSATSFVFMSYQPIIPKMDRTLNAKGLAGYLLRCHTEKLS